MRSLDRKLGNIRAGKYTPGDFIIADAKDGDIGFGRGAPVKDTEGRFTPRETHLQAIREMTKSGLVDIMLMSASTAERLSNEGLFAGSDVTPAIRLNDTTDIWSARGGRYKEAPSRHHRTARVDQAKTFTDLGLYSVTFSNERDIDAENAEAYSDFRDDANANNQWNGDDTRLAFRRAAAVKEHLVTEHGFIPNRVEARAWAMQVPSVKTSSRGVDARLVQPQVDVTP